MEKMIQIPEWQMKEIEDTLRLANNIHHSQKRETCFDRCVCKAWDFAKKALEINENQNISSPISNHFKLENKMCITCEYTQFGKSHTPCSLCFKKSHYSKSLNFE